MEGADIGALFSLFVITLFVVYQALVTAEGDPLKTITRGPVRVAVVAVCAVLISAQTLTALIGVNIKGAAGTEQDARTKAEKWDWATQWSLPKREALGLVVPGLFGYRMDTPQDMAMFADSFAGGHYWGAMGRDPAWDRYFASGKQGPPPSPNAVLRFSGGGCYAGVLVVLVALWAAFQAFRRRDSVFTLTERRQVWFWAATAVVCLPIAFGRFAPFYRLVYELPYFSTIRNPAKFIAIFTFAALILFAYGIHGLSRRYLDVALSDAAGLIDRLISLAIERFEKEQKLKTNFK
jgi:hypothetical protein